MPISTTYTSRTEGVPAYDKGQSIGLFFIENECTTLYAPEGRQYDILLVYIYIFNFVNLSKNRL